MGLAIFDAITIHISRVLEALFDALEYRLARRALRRRKLLITFFVIILSLFGLGTESQGQQLRDAFRKVAGAVVVLRTNQKELAPFPQQGMVISVPLTP